MATSRVKKNPATVKSDTKAVETKVVDPKPHHHGNYYELLVEHFAKPSTIIDAATFLAELNKIDAGVAAKKVETFLENAKIDQTLEVKAGTGANEGQFLIARVPQSAQHKEMKVKAKETKVKKVAEKKGAKTEKQQSTKLVVEKKDTQQNVLAKFLSKGFYTLEHTLEVMRSVPVFEGKTDKRITDAIRDMTTRSRFAEWLTAHGFKVEKREHKGQTEFHLAHI